MTEIVRRRPKLVQREPITARFPLGLEVSVTEDFGEDRYAGRHGVVVSVSTERDEVYPRGRVGVRLVVDELYSKLFSGRPPKTVWFKPNYLERRT